MQVAQEADVSEAKGETDRMSHDNTGFDKNNLYMPDGGLIVLTFIDEITV